MLLAVLIRQADRIREHARVKYIEPARRKGESTVRIRVGDVRKELGFANDQVPAICGALRARKFRDENHLILEKLEGPPKKQATTVTFTYRLADSRTMTQEAQTDAAFFALRGIGKEVFRALGGGEAFIRKEREQFHGTGDES